MKTNEPTPPHDESSDSKAASSATPWILILLGWIFVLCVMTVVVTIAVKNAPQSVPLDPPPAHGR